MRTITGERLAFIVGGRAWLPQGGNNLCNAAIERASVPGKVAGWGTGLVGSTAAAVKILGRFPPKTPFGGTVQAVTTVASILGSTDLAMHAGEYAAGLYAKHTDPACK